MRPRQLLHSHPPYSNQTGQQSLENHVLKVQELGDVPRLADFHLKFKHILKTWSIEVADVPDREIVPEEILAVHPDD